MDALHSVSPATRKDAATQLGQMRAAGAVNPLLRLLRDPRKDVRSTAIDALGQIADSRAVPALCAFLEKEEDWKLRRAAAVALGEIADARAVESLAGALADEQPPVAVAAAGSLTSLGAPARPALQKALASREDQVKELACTALGLEGDPSVIPIIRPLLDDVAAGTRLAAADALSRLADTGSISRIAAMLEESDDATRDTALDALARFGSSAVSPLTVLITSKDPRARQAAARALRAIDQDAAIAPMLIASGDSDGAVNTIADDFLQQRVSGGKGTAPLLEALGHAHPAARLNALRMLRVLERPVPHRLLLTALRDPEPHIRRETAEMLGSAPAAAAADALAAMLADPDPDVKLAAAGSLSKMRDTRGIDTLLSSARSSSQRLAGLGKDHRGLYAELARINKAVEALGSQAEKETVAALITVLGAGDRGGAALASKCLGLIGDPSAVEPLMSAISRADHNDKRYHNTIIPAATEALGHIGDSRAFDFLLNLARTTRYNWVKTREVAFRALLNIDRRRLTEPLIEVLAETLPYDTHQLKLLAGVVAELGDPRAIPVLLGMFRSDLSEVRIAAMDAMKKLGSEHPQALEAFVQQLDTLAVGQRSAISLALAEMGEASFDRLVVGLRDASPKIRQGAAWALGFQATARGLDPLLNVVSDRHAHVRASVAWALAEHRDPRAIPALMALTSDSESHVRRAAAEALGSLQAEQALSVLLGLTNDGDADVRKAAVTAVTQMPGGQARETLRTLREHEDPAVRFIAERGTAE